MRPDNHIKGLVLSWRKIIAKGRTDGVEFRRFFFYLFGKFRKQRGRPFFTSVKNEDPSVCSHTIKGQAIKEAKSPLNF